MEDMYVGKAKESENVCVRAIEILSTMYVQAGCIYACRISMVRAPTEKKFYSATSFAAIHFGILCNSTAR
jgi:hypothetical protein